MISENKKEFFMFQALEEAKKAKMIDEVPVGCVIVLNDEIISKGHNRVMEKKSAIFHAEVEAIIESGKKIGDFRLEECEMYVTLEPCAMCAGAIVNSRIKKVYIGAFDHKRGFCGSVDNLLQNKFLNHNVESESGILKDECLEIIQEFFENLRERKK